MTNDQRKPKCREYFKDFLTKQELSLDKLKGDKERSRQFAKFYVTEIYNAQNTPISEDDFDQAWVDNSGDLGADFIHRDNGVVVLLQSTYAKENSEADTGKINYFRDLIDRLQNKNLKANQAVRQAVEQINWKSDHFVCHYITLARIANQARTIADSPLPKFSVSEERINYSFFGESDLNDELRKALTVGVESLASLDFYAYKSAQKGNSIIELEMGDFASYVLVVPAAQLVSIYDRPDAREALFNLNIRNYLGTSVVNKAIMKTAEEDPQLFFHLNNGISCLASEVEVSGNRLTVTGLQVINGAQTVRTLVAAHRKVKKWDVEEPTVLMRITVVAKGYGEGRRFKAGIVRANNTQNAIKDADYRSNDPIQRDLVKQFQTYKRLGKSVVYIPKRTDPQDQRNSHVIRSHEFAKTIFSFINDPAKCEGHSARLFNDTDQGFYKDVFGSGDEVWDKMPLLEFRFRSAIWWMSLDFSRRLKTDRADTVVLAERDALLEKVWVLCAARLILEQQYGDDYKTTLAAHYEGKWTMSEGEDGKWFETLYGWATTVVKTVYSTASTSIDFNRRNWLRSPSTMPALASQVRNFKTVIKLYGK